MMSHIQKQFIKFFFLLSINSCQATGSIDWLKNSTDYFDPAINPLYGATEFMSGTTRVLYVCTIMNVDKPEGDIGKLMNNLFYHVPDGTSFVPTENRINLAYYFTPEAIGTILAYVENLKNSVDTALEKLSDVEKLTSEVKKTHKNLFDDLKKNFVKKVKDALFLQCGGEKLIKTMASSIRKRLNELTAKISDYKLNEDKIETDIDRLKGEAKDCKNKLDKLIKIKGKLTGTEKNKKKIELKMTAQKSEAENQIKGEIESQIAEPIFSFVLHKKFVTATEKIQKACSYLGGTMFAANKMKLNEFFDLDQLNRVLTAFLWAKISTPDEYKNFVLALRKHLSEDLQKKLFKISLEKINFDDHYNKDDFSKIKNEYTNYSDLETEKTFEKLVFLVFGYSVYAAPFPPAITAFTGNCLERTLKSFIDILAFDPIKRQYDANKLKKIGIAEEIINFYEKNPSIADINWTEWDQACAKVLAEPLHSVGRSLAAGYFNVITAFALIFNVDGGAHDPGCAERVFTNISKKIKEGLSLALTNDIPQEGFTNTNNIIYIKLTLLQGQHTLVMTLQIEPSHAALNRAADADKELFEIKNFITNKFDSQENPKEKALSDIKTFMHDYYGESYREDFYSTESNSWERKDVTQEQALAKMENILQTNDAINSNDIQEKIIEKIKPFRDSFFKKASSEQRNEFIKNTLDSASEQLKKYKPIPKHLSLGYRQVAGPSWADYYFFTKITGTETTSKTMPLTYSMITKSAPTTLDSVLKKIFEDLKNLSNEEAVKKYILIATIKNVFPFSSGYSVRKDLASLCIAKEISALYPMLKNYIAEPSTSVDFLKIEDNQTFTEKYVIPIFKKISIPRRKQDMLDVILACYEKTSSKECFKGIKKCLEDLTTSGYQAGDKTQRAILSGKKEEYLQLFTTLIKGIVTDFTKTALKLGNWMTYEIKKTYAEICNTLDNNEVSNKIKDELKNQLKFIKESLDSAIENVQKEETKTAYLNTKQPGNREYYAREYDQTVDETKKLITDIGKHLIKLNL